MRKTWLAAAAIASLGLAVSGCSSSSNDSATPTTTAAPAATDAPKDTTPDTKTTETKSDASADEIAFGKAFISKLGIDSSEKVEVCLGQKFLGDADIASVLKAGGNPTSEQTAQMYEFMFACGITPKDTAPLFTKGVTSKYTLTDKQTACVDEQFASLSEDDIVKLIASTDPSLSQQIGVRVVTACGIDETTPTSAA